MTLLRTPIAVSSALSLLFLSGCGSSGSDATNPPLPAPVAIAADYQGVWVSPAYGKIWQVDDDSITEFSYTSDYCLMTNENDDVDTSHIQALARLSNDGNALHEYTLSSTTGFNQHIHTYEKVAALPNACESNRVAIVGQQGYQADAERDLAMFYQLFEEHYVSFDLKGVDWPGLYAEVSPLVSPTSDEQTLIEALVEMLTPLSDVHNSLLFQNGASFSVSNKPLMTELLVAEYAAQNDLPWPIDADLLTNTLIEQINTYIESQLNLTDAIIAGYAEGGSEIKRGANGQFVWFSNEGLGYLRINNMAYFSEKIDGDVPSEVFDSWYAAINVALDEALTDLSETDGLIIDIRNNPGGQETMALAIASRFADQQRLVYSKQARLGSDTAPIREVFVEPLGDIRYTKDIVVLTSNSTVSAAEYFAQTMSEMPHVVLVGESTQGAFSETLDWVLPIGIQLKLSNEFFYNPEGEWLESIGVDVDIEVPYMNLSDRENEIDGGIELAIALLSQ